MPKFVFWIICHFTFVYVLSTPAALSESHGSCKKQVTVSHPVTLPTLPFPFHWLQTPDFFKTKNRLLQTPSPPSCCPLTSIHLLPPGTQAFMGKVFICHAHSEPHVSIQKGAPVPLCRHYPSWYETDKMFPFFSKLLLG